MKANETPIADLIEKARADEGSLSVDEIEALERYKRLTAKPVKASKGAARPKALSEAAEVERMAGLCATDETIANAVGVSVRTIQRKYSAITRKARALRRIKLLECQWAAVEKLVPAALIWAGKQFLDQKDAPAPMLESTKPVPAELKIVRPNTSKLGA